MALQRVVLAALGGLPLLALAVTLVGLWIAPHAVAGGNWVGVGGRVILLEFVVLHSGAFMAVGPMICAKWWQRLGWFAGFLAVYAGAFVGFAVWTKSRSIVWVIAALLLSRLIVLVIGTGTGPDKKATILMMQRSVVGTFVFLATALVCFVPLPDLGLGPEIRESAFGGATDDVLARHPERFVAWGALYFLLMGSLELYVGWKLPDWSEEDVEKTWRALRAK